MTTETTPTHGRQTNATASRTGIAAREALLARRGQNGGRKSQISWRVVAADLGMPRSDSMLARVAAGKAKPSRRLLRALGLEKPRRQYIGLVTRTIGAVQCFKCGKAERADENTRATVIRVLVRAGWVFSDAGPVCKECNGQS